jgi:membrane protease YdiL (CAAX protease family)
MNLNESDNILPLDAPVANIEQLSVYPKIKDLVWLFLVFFLYNIIFGIAYGISLILFDSYGIKSSLLKSLPSFILYLGIMSFTIMYAIKNGKRREDHIFRISFNRVPIWLVSIVIISTAALVVLLNRVSALIPMPVSVQKFFEGMFTKDFFSIITLVIAAPILEEMLCRGIVLRGLLKNYAPAYAILISAIFFAVLHMNPWQAVPAFFGGLFIGWVYYKTKSIIPGIIIHATINGIAALLLFFPKYQNDFLTVLGLSYYIPLFVLSILVLSAGCIIIQKRLSTVDPAADR